MLPGPYRLFMGGHHGPFPAAVVSQPVLPSYEARRPDFLWLTSDSMNFWVVPIEIESPGKKWFTKKGLQTADLTQALDQMRDWKRWFQEPHNLASFLDYYDVPRSSHQVIAFHYVLIYGRRDEAIRSPWPKKRHFMRQPDESIMSFDRLRPDRELADIITVRREGGVFHALHAQPTVQLNRFVVTDWKQVQGVEQVIERNPEIESSRKAYLLKMLKKWDEQLECERVTE